jgi:hypothetical protein
MNPLIRIASLVAALSIFALMAQAATPLPNWKNFAALDTVQVVTADDDEEQTRRETTVWLAVHDGQGYIRTGATTWGDNVRRDPEVVLIMNGVDYELRATPIPEGPLYEAVTQVFRDKYGFSDALIGLFRGIGGTPTIFHLEGRESIPMGN